MKKDNKSPKVNRMTLRYAAAALILILIICGATAAFYLSLEKEIYNERASYLKEITAQTVTSTDTISKTQWELTGIFANHIMGEQLHDHSALSAFLVKEEAMFQLNGLSFIVFDQQGNYYDAKGNKVRWVGSSIRIQADSPDEQVEITTFPTNTKQTDEMVFVKKLSKKVLIGNDNTISHVAVVRDMSVFNENFQIPSFEGKGENYIVSKVGTRVYRGQTQNKVIGNAFNVIKPLETLSFRYDGSFEKLQLAIATQKSCSLEFVNTDGGHYYVTAAPLSTNQWSLVSIVPSTIVSAKMQNFMNRTLYGIGALAILIMVMISLPTFMIARYRSSQKLIVQQQEANLALQKATMAAQEASRAKTVFLTHVSHDIRTPINGVLGMSDIAMRNLDDPSRLKDCLNKIISASHHLLSLVNDVLDMSKIESGKIQIEQRPFNIDTLLDGCYSVIAGQAMNRNIDLHKDFDGLQEHYLLGDELHLRQIIINILGNAVKFTPEYGKIEFLAETQRRNEKECELKLVISDTGIGMSEEFQQHVFEPFAQEKDDGRTRYEGTGLGMSIVKQLLEQMNGEIIVDSALGKGSSFTIHLHLSLDPEPHGKQEHTQSVDKLTGMHVLLVEDNDLNLEIATFILEDCGIKVTTAQNGEEAVRTFLKQPAGSFDVILMDLMMPVMDGMEATRQIRSSEREYAKGIPIIAMTANAYVEDRKTTREAGMDGHLIKPIERSVLIQELSKYYKQP